MLERPPVHAPRAAVATSHPLATEAALRTLRQGGSAADATVAAGAVLCVVEPWASHLGGDAFAVLWDAPERRARAIQGSGAAPRRCEAAEILSRGAIPVRGAVPITVPGMIGAWWRLLETRGRLPQAQVLEPALTLAREGFPVGGRWERAGRLERALIAQDPALTALFGTTERPVRAGAWIRQPDLARSLEGLAREGASYFYRGALGEAVVREVRERGGSLASEDLEAHATEEVDPVFWKSGDLEVLEQPPPSQGVMVLGMLAILEEADARGWSLRGDLPRAIAREMHLEIMAYRRMAEERDRWLCDPRAADEEARARVAAWPTAEFARDAIAAIDRDRTAPGPGRPAADSPSTTYLCVADAEGNAVSWIQSIFHPFGAGWIVPGTGILLNNRLTGFSTDPRSRNRLEAGKRPVHTLNAWMALRGGVPWLIGGTPGGEKQVQTNVQILRSRLAGERELAEALRFPRWSIDEWDRVAVEARLPREARRRLEKRGHPVVRIGPWGGSGLVQAIERLPEGGWKACTDPRGEGAAAGY